MKYSLDTMRAVLASAKAALAEVGKAKQEATARREHYQNVRLAARSAIAQCVAQGILIGAGPAAIRGIVADYFVDDKRSGASTSEAWSVLHKHEYRDKLTVAWARGDFKVPVARALQDIRPTPDQYKLVSKAIHNALVNGLSDDDILKAIATGRQQWQQEQPRVKTQKVA